VTEAADDLAQQGDSALRRALSSFKATS